MTEQRIPPLRLNAICSIASNVQSSLRSKVSNFAILLKEEGLVILGQTDTYYAKQLAQHAVMHATDIPIKENRIRVTRSDGLATGDRDH